MFPDCWAPASHTECEKVGRKWSKYFESLYNGTLPPFSHCQEWPLGSTVLYRQFERKLVEKLFNFDQSYAGYWLMFHFTVHTLPNLFFWQESESVGAFEYACMCIIFHISVTDSLLLTSSMTRYLGSSLHLYILEDIDKKFLHQRAPHMYLQTDK